MRGRTAGITAATLLALLLLSSTTAQATPLPVSEVSIDGDVDLNNRVRYAFQTVPESVKYDIYYSDESFNNLTGIVPTASSVVGFPDAWIFVSEDPADDPSIQETLKFFRCWWSLTTIPENLAIDFQFEENWFEPTFSTGMPVIPPDAISVVCDLPGIVRGQEVYVATVAVGEDGSSTEEGLAVLSAITTAESERPPDPDMTPVYIAIGVIVGGLCLTALVLYFLSPSRRERSGYLFILPAILLLATLTFYPVGYGIYLSFGPPSKKLTDSFDEHEH